MSDNKDNRRVWFGRVFGKKRKLPPPTVDHAAIGIGSEAVTLFQEALSAGLMLGGQLVARRDAIVEAATQGNADVATRLLVAYRNDIEGSKAVLDQVARTPDPAGMTVDEAFAVQSLRLTLHEQVDAVQVAEAWDTLDQLRTTTSLAEMRTDLGADVFAEMLKNEASALKAPTGATPADLKFVQDARAAVLAVLTDPPTPQKVEQALALMPAVRKAIESVKRRQEVADADPALLYARLKLRVADVTGYPAEFRSTAIGKLCDKVASQDQKTQQKINAIEGGGDKAKSAAATAVAELRNRLDVAATPLREHDLEVRRYYERLKKLKPRLAAADGMPTTDGGGNTAWKAEREAYDLARAEVITHQNKHAYARANRRLTALELATEALIAKRLLSVDGDITTATTSGNAEADSRTLVDELQNSGLIKVLTPQQHLALLKALPDGDDNKDARIALFSQPSLVPAFVAAETGARQAIVKTLRGGNGSDQEKAARRDWDEAEANWPEWAKNDPDKILAVFTKTVLMQFKELCKLAGYAKDSDYPPGFPTPPVTVVLGDKPKNIFGDTTPDFPAVITINKNHRSFGDFKEMIDTILHENSHAWQNMIVAQFNKSGPFGKADKQKLTGNPAMATQAELFAQNDESYFNSDVSQDAYRHEPLEEQAWTFGGKASQALLIPPQVRSFESKRGLKNKLWRVASLTRTASAQLRLVERHGFYVDEWEGETAGDKKLQLESVPGLGGSRAVRVTGVVDEYILRLDLDASTLPGRAVPQAEIDTELRTLAAKRHKRKKLEDLSDKQRKALIEKIVEDNGWVQSGSESGQDLVLREDEFADVEHARLVLDETVDNLA